MRPRSAFGLLAGLLVVGLIGLPVLAFPPLGQPSDTQPLDGQPGLSAPQGAEPQADEPADAEQLAQHDEGPGRCHGIQRAYWAVTGNPGDGEGKEEAAAELARVAGERDCELSDSPPDGWHGGPPPWAGGPPPWAGNDADDAEEAEGEGRGRPAWATEGDGPPWGPPPWAGKGRDEGIEDERGEGRRGPKWASEGDRPPWGLAWGFWLEHGGDDVCGRIAARMDAHPNATVPEDLRERLENELGCDLP